MQPVPAELPADLSVESPAPAEPPTPAEPPAAAEPPTAAEPPAAAELPFSAEPPALMEVKGCGADCDGDCTACEWEACTVTADNGPRLDVRITADGELCLGVLRRHVRAVARVDHKRGASGVDVPFRSQ